MFDPLDFLKLAEELISFGDEARLRTAVSRAYYGAFLFSREWLRAKRWLLYGDARDHYRVKNGLRKYRGRKISDKLHFLYRKLRGDADYELTKVIDKRVAIKAIKLANIVIDSLLSNPPSNTS
ncbi:MAG: hypothetical protein J7J51_00600 [Candidatus Omnitrophica bacterium]|nr:hypothetical protein [Candidatus Omnitrophota bacterium]